MDLKSFFDLEKVVFSNEELEAPYEDELADVIFIRKDNLYEDKPIIFSEETSPHENNSTSPIFSRNDLQKLKKEEKQ